MIKKLLSLFLLLGCFSFAKAGNSVLVDFETGDFSQFAFQNNSEYPWIVTNSTAASGTYCMKSGNAGMHATSSIISATYTYASDGYIGFDAKCLGEGYANAWDKCIFYIDNVVQFTYGELDDCWEVYVFQVSAGTHVFKWEYTKDGSASSDGDAFFVDNVNFGLGAPCTALSNLKILTFASGATLTWKGYSDSFNLQYRKAGGNWTTVNGITENTYTITNLSSGNYEVKVQSACDGTQVLSGTFEIAEVLSTADWYGFACYAIGGESWQNSFICFPMQGLTVSVASEPFPMNYAATYCNGYVWFISYEYEGGYTVHHLYKAPVDENAKFIGTPQKVVQNFENSSSVLSMSYNYDNGMIYYLTYVDDEKRNLCCFNPDSPYSIIGHSLAVPIQTFAINGNGEAYGIENETGKLYRINLIDGSTTLIGDTDVPMYYVQSMAFDLDTDELFWAQIYDASAASVYKVNPATAKATCIGKIGNRGTELTGLFMIPKTAPRQNYIDFETGDFSQYSFQNSSQYPWIITDVDAAAGTYCMKSGNAGKASSTSSITATYTFTEAGYVAFNAKCMGEGSSTALDKCVFSIDGQPQFSFGDRGNTWFYHYYPVASGSHTFKWEYTKNGSVNPEGDAFFVDNIRFLQGSSAGDAITTDISSIKSNTEEEIIYNLAGQRLSKKQQGINIVNGRKVLVK